MKPLRSRFPFPALAILLAAFATGPLVAAEKAPTGKFQLSWTRVLAPEHKFTLEMLKNSEQRFSTGQVSKEELLHHRHQIEMLERRAAYSITIHSTGGTLREFVAATSGSDEISFTLINAGDPADLDAPIPAFTLRNSNWGTVIEVLANFLATRGLKLAIAGSDNPNPNESKSVVCVLRRIEPPAGARGSAQSGFEAFALADHISERQPFEVIVDAIQTALKLDSPRGADALRVKFHPATKMLFVSGPESVTRVARQVIASLPKNPVAR